MPTPTHYPDFSSSDMHTHAHIQSSLYLSEFMSLGLTCCASGFVLDLSSSISTEVLSFLSLFWFMGTHKFMQCAGSQEFIQHKDIDCLCKISPEL